MKKSILILLVLCSFALAGCADIKEEYNDAPVSGNNDKPAYRIAFPDGFSNVARKCDGPNMVYATRNGDGRGLSVIANDPRCVGSLNKKDHE